MYYTEYRSNGESNVKLYVQKKTVSYADYKIGMCYISLDDIMEEDRRHILTRHPIPSTATDEVEEAS